MPGTYGDALTENIANGLGFKGVRGTGSLSSTLGIGRARIRRWRTGRY